MPTGARDHGEHGSPCPGCWWRLGQQGDLRYQRAQILAQRGSERVWRGTWGQWSRCAPIPALVPSRLCLLSSWGTYVYVYLVDIVCSPSVAHVYVCTMWMMIMSSMCTKIIVRVYQDTKINDQEPPRYPQATKSPKSKRVRGREAHPEAYGPSTLHIDQVH